MEKPLPSDTHNVPALQTNLPVKKEEGMFAEIQNEMMASLIEGILPKIKPLIKPALDGLAKYLGNNEKIILIRQNSVGSSTKVIVLNNTKFPGYSIINEEGQQTVSVDQACIEGVYDSNEFIEMLFSGKLSKLSELLENGNK